MNPEKNELLEHEADEDEASANANSVSPRNIHPQSVARRLDFSSFAATFTTTRLQQQHSAASTDSVELWENAEPIQTTVGECNVCYDLLPLRSNHVFTVCGHLFCVKCLLKWWDTSSACPICRAEILKLDARDPASAAAVDVAEANDSSDYDDADDDDDDDDNDIRLAMDVVWRDWNAGSFARVLGGVIEEQQSAIPVTPVIDNYLYADEGIEWSSLSGHTDPDRDDGLVQVLSQSECANLRSNRELASILWARRRFNDTLFSNIEFTGETFHTFIWKQFWSRMSNFDIGQHRMFEFVMRQTAPCNAPSQRETNFFGYISGIILTHAINPDNLQLWENRHEYAFVVHVFCPSSSAPFGSYNIDEGTFETVELIFRFSDIRRMYRIMTCEISTW